MRKYLFFPKSLSKCLNEEDNEAKGFLEEEKKACSAKKNDKVSQECHKLKRKSKFKKKSLMATWEDSDSGSNKHITLCLMDGIDEEVHFKLISDFLSTSNSYCS